MLDYKECRDLIEQEIEKYNIGKEPKELYEPIRYILSLGGKRIRPCLSLMAYNLFKEDIEKAIPVALAVEVFHNFTLLHDDIMDGAILRRNQPTVHVKWDSNVGILSGDAMMIKAYDLISTVEKSKLHSLFKEFNKVALEVCEGQQNDMNFEKRPYVSVDEYINMIRLKTSVLIASALKMGAILGDAGKNDRKLIYDFGLNLGLGFQLQDDYLDTYGDSTSFGKKIGGDIVANKKTFLLTMALSLAKGDDLNNLKRLVTSHEVSREVKIEMVREIYDKLGIQNIIKQRIKDYFEKALKSLEGLSVTREKTVYLKEVVGLLTNRYQ